MQPPHAIAEGTRRPVDDARRWGLGERGKPGGRLPWLVFLLLGCLGTPMRGAAQPAGATAEAASLMATYLTHFVGFTTWPDSVRAQIAAGEGAGFVVGVLGTDPFGDRLDEAFRGKRFANRPVLVRRLKTEQELRDCQLLFISRSEAGRVRALLEALQDRPILTVSDIPGFVGVGGLVGFHEERSKMHFDINLEGTRRSGLTMSSQLLKLAWNLQRDRK